MVAKKSKYHKNCSICGADQYYGRSDHYNSAVKNDWKCKSCSGHINSFKGKVGPIPVTWFEMKKKSGIGRGYEWELSIEDILEIYEKQNNLCALTGWPISWSKKGLTATASIDRIDPNLGYLKTNIQLLHKHVNMAKQKYSQKYFIEMCQAVADKTKW